MASAEDRPIGRAEIEKYLDSRSDFSFELKVLEKLAELGLSCRHSGFHDDPSSRAPRQFDIHASVASGDLRVHLAVECANLRAGEALLAHCLARSEPECFHEIVVSLARQADGGTQPDKPPISRHVLRGAESLYEPGGMLARSVDEVCMRDEGFAIARGTAREKLALAIATGFDLIQHSVQASPDATLAYLFLPVLVVPDGRIWRVRYAAGGAREGEPDQADHVSYWVDRYWQNALPLRSAPLSYRMGYLEIVSMSGLARFVSEWLGSVDHWRRVFPRAPGEYAAGRGG